MPITMYDAGLVAGRQQERQRPALQSSMPQMPGEDELLVGCSLAVSSLLCSA